LEKDAEHWVLHGGCLNEVGNLYGGSEMVARVGKAIKKEMVLERMEEDKKEEEEVRKGGRGQIEGRELKQRERGEFLEEEFWGRKTEGQREELCSYELWLCFDLPLRLIGS